ncbi:multidrug efflux RND transporter permease subunit MexK [Bowmanella denitrificans]|uniref:Multidrug efflux RND transporter permease subunit MexK n=1 Tax=Bowmanella denitrificans TaxID=366582 RepID=A0ABP3GMG4_9ALTE
MQSTHWYLRTRQILGLVLLLCLTGLMTWYSAFEQEDPHFPYRNGFILLSQAGASVDQLTQSAVMPVERELSQIDEIANYSARIKTGSASIDIELKETVYDTEIVWQRIKDKLAPLQSAMPTTRQSVIDRAQDTQGIVLAVDSNRGILADRELALKVKDRLLQLDSIRHISLVGDPGLQLAVRYSQQRMLETGISPLALAKQIAQANQGDSPALLQTGKMLAAVQPMGRLNSVEAVESIQIAGPQNFPLSSLADISFRPDPLATERFYLNGRQTIGLAITLPPNQVRVTKFGHQLRHEIALLNREFAPASIDILLFQPEWSEARRSDLLQSLMFSCVAVCLVLMALMSIRTALVVSLSIPAIALSALGIFGIFGGVIHQMTIAGLILSLGMMVDNSIVMAERILFHTESGRQRIDACLAALKELWRPLATATATTIAAFVPMLLSKGSVADFISSIPVLVILSILLSYLIALSLVPLLSRHMIAQHTRPSRQDVLISTGSRLACLALQKPKATLFFAALVSTLLLMLPATQGEFFPKTSRNQAYVDIALPVGTDPEQTAQVANQLAGQLQHHPDIKQVLTFTGHSGPRFYYNLVQQPEEAHIARLVIITQPHADTPALVSKLNQQFIDQYPQWMLTARELGQGPPIESPIELRIVATQQRDATAAAEAIRDIVLAHPQTQNVRRDYAFGSPQLGFALNKQQLVQSGLSVAMVNQFLAWRSSGLEVTRLDFTSLPIPLVLTAESQQSSAQSLADTQLLNDQQQLIPLSLVADVHFHTSLPMKTRRNGLETLIVRADIHPHADEEDILLQMLPELEAVAQKYQVGLQLGGEFEESSQASNALLTALPAGLAILFISLILQFNSYRLSALVMISIPLGMLGAPAMLAMADIPFGFMSLLGLLALTGIVVNSAILLIESALVGLQQGLHKAHAITRAVSERLRPIVLTTITTIAGMLPLTFGDSPLWPPLAWAVIGGLISSTALMLLVMPLALNWLLSEAQQSMGQ